MADISGDADFSRNATPLFLNYGARLSFAAHNRRSSLADSVRSMARSDSNHSSAVVDAEETEPLSPMLPPTRRPSSLNHYGLTTVATRRDSNSSVKSISTPNNPQKSLAAAQAQARDYFESVSQPEVTPEASTSIPSVSRSTSTKSMSSASGHSPTRHQSHAANMLQNKRRQASGPFQRSISHSDMALSEISPTGTNPPSMPPQIRRQRSRGPTRMFSGDFLPPLSPLFADSEREHFNQSDSSVRAQSLWNSFDPTSEVIMTPTTEEWTSYGGFIGSNRIRAKSGRSPRLAHQSLPDEAQSDVEDDEADSDSGSDSSSSSDAAVESETDDALPLYPKQTSHPRLDTNLEKLSEAEKEKTQLQPVSASTSNLDVTNMSSYMSPTASKDAVSTSLVLIDLPPSRAETPIPLDPVGPVDPKLYSVKTGARNIGSFFIQGSAGSGGYGTVVRARERGADGWSEGPELIIKSIIKSRILADCWNKHRILGAIPVEIHVLDHLRRIPYSAILPPFKGDLSPPPPTGHPNICVILDFFEDAEHWYLCMAEFGRGQDLFDYVDKAPDGLDLIEVQRFFTQIASAVAFLHMHGIVHRDIKDENIILDGEGRVQLVDFGSAAYVKEGRKFDTFSGTLDFAAPEVLRGERYDGRQTDVWALGVLGYVMLCGESPFWTREEAAFGLADKTRARTALEVKVASCADPQLMRDAIDLVAACLEASAADRPNAAQVCRHRFILSQFDDHPGLMEKAWTGKGGFLSAL